MRKFGRGKIIEAEQTPDDGEAAVDRERVAMEEEEQKRVARHQKVPWAENSAR